ncbi:MAG: glycosyltransferase family 4 protein [Clostridiales bacterium]|jgi:glycosyltransferase involved in cell wall biosynthesis|nr:glycosyltransferase family 4 protein [Clostridiales bacterium]
MKIVQINKYFYPRGGSETVFFNTIELLEQHGHTVIPFCMRNVKNLDSPYASYFVDYPEFSESGFWTKIRHIPSFIYNRKAAKQLDRLLEREKPDIAHIHLLFNSLSVSILPVLKKHRVPVVMTAHDHRLICPAYLFIDGKRKVCERCRDGHFYHCALHRCSKGQLFQSVMLTIDSYFRKYRLSPLDYVDRFIFVGHFSRGKHIAFSAKYEGSSSVLFNFTPIQPQAVTPKDDYLLYFGRISEEKGIPTLMRAMEEFPDVKLKIVGTGSLLEELKGRSLPNIEFTGYRSGEDLHDYIRKARFIIVPSECYENNTLVIIESYTLGTPAIGSRIGGIPEFIQDGQNGFLFEPGSVVQLREKIRQALSLSPESYANMCQEAQVFAANNFSGDMYYKKLISLYKEVIKNKKE